MNVHISYKAAKSPGIEREFNQQIQRLEKRLQVFRPELVHLHAIVEENSAREGVVTSLNLRLPSGQLAAQESGANGVAVLKKAFGEILTQLTKHKDLLRSQHHWRRGFKQGRERHVTAFEDTVAAVRPAPVTDQDLTAYVNANFARFHDYVAREIRYREASTQVTPGQIQPEEIIGEVVATAMGENGDRPEALTLERWLYGLARRTIDDFVNSSTADDSALPLPRPAKAPDSEPSDDSIPELIEPEPITHGFDALPDPGSESPEDIVAREEMVALVEAALLQAKPEERESFVLFALEGFTPEEIAAITQRTSDSVKQEVQRARQHLEKALPASVPLKDKLLQHSRIA